MNKAWDNPIEHAMPASARVPPEVRIGAVVVRPATVLAPMAGVTDTVFRRFIRHASLFTKGQGSGIRGQGTGIRGQGTGIRDQGSGIRDREATQGVMDKRVPGMAQIEAAITNAQSGCGLLMTEFTSADGLARMRESKRRRYLTFYDDEHPIGAQLFGSSAETLGEAARIVEDWGFDTVDLNLGCPAKRVVGCNGGSGLLRDLPKIAEIFSAVRSAVAIPFTVKFRTGWNDAQIVCVEVARMAEAEGLNAVALHARTREQGYSGQAQWGWIAQVKAAVRIPVIGNGDIRTPEDAAAMIAETGCNAVMIGRAAPANPWIFRQIAQYTATGAYDEPTVEDRYRMIRTYFAMLLEEAESGVPADRSSSVGREASQSRPREARIGETAGKMKQFAAWFTHGVPGGAKLRAAIYQAKTGVEVLARVDEFFSAQIDRLANGDDCSLQPDDPGEQMFPDGALVCD